DSNRTSRTASSSDGYDQNRTPPSDGPSAVECTAMTARSPTVASLTNTTCSCPCAPIQPVTSTAGMYAYARPVTGDDLRRAATLPASAYHDPAVYERERHAVFAREWQLAGFRAQLHEPGDYVAHDVAGWRVFVVVAPDGGLRAFHNVCRHRAG